MPTAGLVGALRNGGETQEAVAVAVAEDEPPEEGLEEPELAPSELLEDELLDPSGPPVPLEEPESLLDDSEELPDSLLPEPDRLSVR